MKFSLAIFLLIYCYSIHALSTSRRTSIVQRAVRVRQRQAAAEGGVCFFTCGSGSSSSPTPGGHVASSSSCRTFGALAGRRRRRVWSSTLGCANADARQARPVFPPSRGQCPAHKHHSRTRMPLLDHTPTPNSFQVSSILKSATEILFE